MNKERQDYRISGFILLILFTQLGNCLIFLFTSTLANPKFINKPTGIPVATR